MTKTWGKKKENRIFLSILFLFLLSRRRQIPKLPKPPNPNVQIPIYVKYSDFNISYGQFGLYDSGFRRLGYSTLSRISGHWNLRFSNLGFRCLRF